MRQISEYIVRLFEKRGVICASAEEREVYIYGFDIAIYTFLSTLGLFFIGWMAGRPIETDVVDFLVLYKSIFRWRISCFLCILCAS